MESSSAKTAELNGEVKSKSGFWLVKEIAGKKHHLLEKYRFFTLVRAESLVA
jgi:hypothetical protein